MEKLTADQSAMKQKLELISAQHAEMEEFIIILEQELSKMPQKIDVGRSQTYVKQRPSIRS